MVQISAVSMLWGLIVLQNPQGGQPELYDGSSASGAGSRQGSGRYEISAAFLPGLCRTLGFVATPF